MTGANARAGRLAIFAPVYCAGRVGVDLVTEHLVAGLAADWDVWFYSWTPLSCVVPGVRQRLLPGYLRSYMARLVWQNLFLPDLMQRDGIEVVLATFSELPVRLQVPAIAVVHDLTPLRVPESSPWRHRLFFGLSIRLLQRAHALITVSEFTKADVRRAGWYPNTPIYAIPNGTDFARAAEAGNRAASARPHCQGPGTATDESPYVLYVGGYSPHKNVSMLISSFAELSQEFPHRLILVGAGSESARSNLRRRASQAGIAGRVEVCGPVPEHELVTLYRGCGLFVYPSRYEGFGLPVLEAMACGAPVLTGNVTAMPEVGGDAARYFAPDCRDDLTAAMRTILSDRALRERMGAQGRRRATLFTWERTVAAYSRVIREVLSRVPARARD